MCRSSKESYTNYRWRMEVGRKMGKGKTFEIVTCAHYFLFYLISRRDKVKQKALNKQPSHSCPIPGHAYCTQKENARQLPMRIYPHSLRETQSESMVHDANVLIIMDPVVRLSFVCYLIRHIAFALFIIRATRMGRTYLHRQTNNPTTTSLN